jgi:predicted acetyltransferase
MTAYEREVIERIMNRARIAVTRDGGEVVGTAASDASLMTVPGLVRAPTAMVVAVMVLPTHRRQGRLTSLMRYQLDDLHSRGEVLASLWASEGGIYGRFGYGQATFGSTYVLDKRTARLHKPRAQRADAGKGRVRLLTRDQACEAVPAVFAEYAPTRPGEFDRNELQFGRALGEPGAEEQSRRWWAVYELDGHIDGYLAYEVAHLEGPWTRERRVIVRELCCLSEAAYAALWDFALSVDLAVEVMAFGRPVDEPLRWMLNDPRQLKTTYSGDRTWVRLLDVAAALRFRYLAGPGSLELGVWDEFCPWNTGVYRLEASSEWAPAEVVFSPGDPEAARDAVLDVEALGSMYLGGVSAGSLAAAGRVKPSSEAVVRRANRMFASDVSPFTLTNF